MAPQPNILLEVCVESLTGALAAQEGGAHCVELCSCLTEGGLTPSHGLMKLARQALHSCRMVVMIRPRGCDFLYSQQELQVMMEDIRAAAVVGADGIAIGVLTASAHVNTGQMQQICSLCKCKGLEVTFHRAFDQVQDHRQALEDLISCGVDRLLTSGCRSTALQGKDVIAELVQQANGRISIMAGCGVHEGNVEDILSQTGVRALHSSARNFLRSRMEHKSKISLTYSGDWDRWQTSAHKVRGLLNSIARYQQNEGKL